MSEAPGQIGGFNVERSKQPALVAWALEERCQCRSAQVVRVLEQRLKRRAFRKAEREKTKEL